MVDKFMQLLTLDADPERHYAQRFRRSDRHTYRHSDRRHHDAKVQSYYVTVRSAKMTAVWLCGNINKVTLRRAGLVLRWVTVRGYTALVFNHTVQANSTWSSLRGYR